MQTFKALGALLSYPTEELIAALPEIRQTLEDERLLSIDVREQIDFLIDRHQAMDLLELQEIYVGLFDRTRSLSLHLYEHVWGDARERGQAMVRLQTLYSLHGFSHTASELPDYLPLFCEFLSLIPEKAARAFLSDAGAVIDALRERLAKRQSHYGAVASALVSLASKAIDRALLEKLSKGNMPDDDSFEALDRAWEEEPVTFGLGEAAPSCGGGAGHRATI